MGVCSTYRDDLCIFQRKESLDDRKAFFLRHLIDKDKNLVVLAFSECIGNLTLQMSRYDNSLIPLRGKSFSFYRGNLDKISEL